MFNYRSLLTSAFAAHVHKQWTLTINDKREHTNRQHLRQTAEAQNGNCIQNLKLCAMLDQNSTPSKDAISPNPVRTRFGSSARPEGAPFGAQPLPSLDSGQPLEVLWNQCRCGSAITWPSDPLGCSQDAPNGQLGCWLEELPHDSRLDALVSRICNYYH